MYTKTGIVASVDTVSRADVQLDVGGTNQQVTVAADAATLQTDKSDQVAYSNRPRCALFALLRPPRLM